MLTVTHHNFSSGKSVKEGKRKKAEKTWIQNIHERDAKKAGVSKRTR